jgi:AraC-like DNA-binding protein
MSTADTPADAGTQFDRFRAAVSSSFVPLDLASPHEGRFKGQLRSRSIDRVHVADIQATDHEVTRTSELIDRGGTSMFKVSVQLDGWGLIIQDDREALLGPGDLAIYDTSRPYSLVFESTMHTAVFMFPHQSLELPPSAVRQLTAVRFGAESGLASVVAPYVGRLATGLEDVRGGSAVRLANAGLDLLGTLFAEELDVETNEQDPHLALRRRIHAYIDEHLGDPALGPGPVAAAHFISTRHLHALFREEGRTVAGWIRSTRLERCRRDLLDPRQRNRSIAEIGQRWGIVDAAHLSHAFKSEFGTSPSEVRAQLTAS